MIPLPFQAPPAHPVWSNDRTVDCGEDALYSSTNALLPTSSCAEPVIDSAVNMLVPETSFAAALGLMRICPPLTVRELARMFSKMQFPAPALVMLRPDAVSGAVTESVLA